MNLWYVVGTSDKDHDAVVYPCINKMEAMSLCDQKSNMFLDWEFSVVKTVYSTMKVKVNV